MSDATAETSPTGDRRARANVLRLAAAQALAGANASVVYATGAIIGSTLAPVPAMNSACLRPCSCHLDPCRGATKTQCCTLLCTASN